MPKKANQGVLDVFFKVEIFHDEILGKKSRLTFRGNVKGDRK